MNALRLVPALIAFAASMGAQSSILVDEATFVIRQSGGLLGTESFKIIRRLGSDGPEYMAQAVRTIEGQVVKSALTCDSSGGATKYSRAVTGRSPAQISAQRSPGRLTVDETGVRTSTKDYLFGPGALIIDDDLIHQLYFATWRDGSRSIAYVSPGSGSAGTTALAALGRETVTIGRDTIAAWRLAFGTGIAKRDIWVDSSRRLLKVSIPSQRLEATREQPPP
jgi:hypothetical protein